MSPDIPRNYGFPEDDGPELREALRRKLEGSSLELVVPEERDPDANVSSLAAFCELRKRLLDKEDP